MQRQLNRTTGWALSAGLLASLLFGGCVMRKLQKDVTELESLGLIGGRAAATTAETAPIVVVLSALASASVVDSFVLPQSGDYFFVVPPGTYRVLAFVDRNRDQQFQPQTEPAAYFGAPTDVGVASGQKVGSIDFAIDSSARLHPTAEMVIPAAGTRGSAALPPVELGEVVTFDDPRFAAKNATLGLWQPVQFMFNVGAGFYFLEPFDPNKMPVLFVHGAGGTPTDWRYLVEHLDRKRFQPWLLYYPSGLDGDTLARGVARWMDTLAAHYQFEHIAVVAHSMGGLVSRAALNDMLGTRVGGMMTGFVSISTPWNGHSAAALGVEYSPVIMPMWRSVEPGSPFIKSLFREPLPVECPYYLMFGFMGNSRMLSEPNDGTVALSSTLAQPAQQVAKNVYGYPENHDSILVSADVSRRLNTILAEMGR